MSIDRLLADHVRIIEQIAMLHRLVEAGPLVEANAVSPIRWALARDLMLHFARIEAELYVPLLSDSRPIAVARASQAIEAIAKLNREYILHIQRWAGDAPVRDWAGYVRAMRSITAHMRTQIDDEARDLMSLLPLQPTEPSRLQPRSNHAADAWKIREMLFGEV